MMSLVNDPRAKKKKGFLSSNSNVWYIWYNPLFEVCGIVCSWNISASSYKRYMCPQLPCCLLNTDLGPNAPAQHWSSACCDSYFPTLFCPFYSIPWVALRFCSLALFFSKFFSFYQFTYSLLLPSFALPSFFFLWRPEIWYWKSPVPLCQQEIEDGRKREKKTQKSIRVR